MIELSANQTHTIDDLVRTHNGDRAIVRPITGQYLTDSVMVKIDTTHYLVGPLGHAVKSAT